MNDWKVVPLSKGQLLDVNLNDILEYGLYRKCDTYKGGGGYDSFPKLAKSRFGVGNYNLQFVVQLYGCNLDCPFCYVTRAGVWGDYELIKTHQLVTSFNASRCNVFHLMGGAPAIVMHKWYELLQQLTAFAKPGWVFHSDLMLTESEYNRSVLADISHRQALYAVGIKGITLHTFYKNTRKEFNSRRFWDNLNKVEEMSVPYYPTFTNVPADERQLFWENFKERFGENRAKEVRREELVIPLIKYKATL